MEKGVKNEYDGENEIIEKNEHEGDINRYITWYEKETNQDALDMFIKEYPNESPLLKRRNV